MAKKKPTHVEKRPPQIHEQTLTPAMGDSEKLENLKTLNSFLLKETVSRREQVESLIRSKGSLESALARSEVERNSMSSELTQLLDCTAMIELEKDVVFVFVSVELGERLEVVERERVEIEGKLRGMERKMGELEEVCGERDWLKCELGVRIEETNGLRLKLVEAEDRERKLQEMFEKLSVEYDVVTEEAHGREMQLEAVLREKLQIERFLEESSGAIDELKLEILEMGRKNTELEEQRMVEVENKTKLENRVAVMNESLLSLEKEEKLLRESVADLERREMDRAEEKERMVREIKGLVLEKAEREASMKDLIEEKNKVGKSLQDALKEINEQTRRIDQLLGEKSEIEEAKLSFEGEIVELKKDIGQFRVAISSVEAENKKKTEEIMGLNTEVNRTRDEIARLISERDDVCKGFEKEKQICVSLKEKVSEMEKKIEVTEKALTKAELENHSVLVEKKELELEFDAWKNKVASLEGTILKGNKENDDLRAKLLKSNAGFGFVLNVMKRVRDLDVDVNEGGYVGEEIKPFVEDFMAIRREIREGEAKVEEMKKQVEVLNNSVEEAHKKKNFWTVVSSATTIFAAASVASAAYIFRGH